MTLLQRVVCATDFSAPSELPVEVAAQWCRKLDRELTVVHVFDPAPVGPSSALPFPAWPTVAAAKSIEDTAKKRLQRLVDDKLAGVPHEVQLVPHPSSSLGICDAATAADLIVVGTQGRTGLDRVVMGSVAEQTIRHAPCPVLAVRGNVRPDAFPKRILVCSDFSTEGQPALTLAGSVSTAFGAQSLLLHARSKRSWIRQLEWMEAEAGPEAETAFRAELDRLHSAYLPPPVQSAFVVSKSVPDAIILHAERENVDLIVLATHGRTGLKRLAMGSVAEHVTRHASCPVLVARTQDGG